MFGILAGIVWYLIARDTPEQHPWVGDNERTLILAERRLSAKVTRADDPASYGKHRIPWSHVLRSRAILAADRVRAREIMSDETPAALLRDDKIDAYFAVAGVPLDSIRDLLVHHQARLVPLDGEGRDRLGDSDQQAARAAQPGTRGEAPLFRAIRR